MRIFLILLIAFTINLSVDAQSKKYFDAPFGGGGGYVPAWYIPDTKPLNAQLKTLGIPELSTSGFYTSGGAGFIYIGFVKNLRVGGMGFGGSTSEKATLNGINREAQYSLGGGGLTVEYTLPFIKDFGVSIGGVIGGGALTVDLYRNSGSFSWDGIWQNIDDGNSTNSYSQISRSFWIFSPTINVDIPLYRFVLFRIGGGYQFTAGGEWKADNDQPLSGVPSDLNGNSFFIQTGLFIGFFSF